jgi:hypothetical protein
MCVTQAADEEPAPAIAAAADALLASFEPGR